MIEPAVFRAELIERRERLSSVLAGVAGEGDAGHRRLVDLLLSVDSALERLDGGTFGLCAVCHGALDEARLRRDPLTAVCLECMTPEQSRALEHDLETAWRFQAAQLPSPRVVHGGWETAYLYEPFGAVSGDTLDLLVPAVADGPLDLLFGDVSGKGVSASLLQSSLRTLFRVLAKPAAGPGRLLEEVNRLFFEATTRNAYATVAILRLHADGTVEYANGGHLPVLRAGGDEGELASPSLPVGLFRDAPYGETRSRLAPGESLLLYTDGLTEAARADGEEYGIPRARAAFARAAGRAPRAALAAVRDDLDRFLDGAPRSDDLSLLVVRWRGGDAAPGDREGSAAVVA